MEVSSHVVVTLRQTESLMLLLFKWKVIPDHDLWINLCIHTSICWQESCIFKLYLYLITVTRYYRADAAICRYWCGWISARVRWLTGGKSWCFPEIWWCNTNHIWWRMGEYSAKGDICIRFPDYCNNLMMLIKLHFHSPHTYNHTHTWSCTEQKWTGSIFLSLSLSLLMIVIQTWSNIFYVNCVQNTTTFYIYSVYEAVSGF